MIKRSMLKEYLRYILPTMLTFTLASVYSIVDGMFVGHAVGDAGVAGINVAFPLVAFVMAVGTGIGMGGGVISSIARGAGDEAKSRRAVGTTFVMLLLAALPVMALLLFAAEPICRLLGGQGGTLAQAVAYTSVIAWGRPVPDIRHGLYAPHPQPGARGLRHGGAGVRGPDERGIGLCVRHAAGLGHSRRRRGHGGVAGCGVRAGARVLPAEEEPHCAGPTCVPTAKSQPMR